MDMMKWLGIKPTHPFDRGHPVFERLVAERNNVMRGMVRWDDLRTELERSGRKCVYSPCIGGGDSFGETLSHLMIAAQENKLGPCHWECAYDQACDGIVLARVQN